tara:strand:+ start:99 stop:293 length:195 start_codon:yes stop_codon:yes gene_type:complete
MPLLESSIAIFDSASFDLWNPGTTIIKGALFLLVAEFGLYINQRLSAAHYLLELSWSLHQLFQN